MNALRASASLRTGLFVQGRLADGLVAEGMRSVQRAAMGRYGRVAPCPQQRILASKGGSLEEKAKNGPHWQAATLPDLVPRQTRGIEVSSAGRIYSAAAGRSNFAGYGFLGGGSIKHPILISGGEGDQPKRPKPITFPGYFPWQPPRAHVADGS